MNFTLRITKTHAVSIVMAMAICASIITVLAVAPSGSPTHPTLYTDMISSKSGSSIKITDNVGINVDAPAQRLAVGGQNGQTNSFISARGGATGNAFEWGHGNQAGYGSTLGFQTGGGGPFVCFGCESGTASNTFRTRGLVGSLYSAILGGHYWYKIANPNADNQVATQLMTLDPTGNLAIVGTLSQGSDARYKTNVQPLTDALAKVKKVEGVSFQRVDNPEPRTQIGFIAQDLEAVVPEVVITDSEGMKSVEYSNMVALLTEAIKEQQQQIDMLKEELDDLKK